MQNKVTKGVYVNSNLRCFFGHDFRKPHFSNKGGLKIYTRLCIRCNKTEVYQRINTKVFVKEHGVWNKKANYLYFRIK